MGLYNTKPKSRYLSNIIKIDSPTSFRTSVRTLSSQKNYNMTKYRALLLAQNRAKASLNRKTLSPKERAQMAAIANIKIPKPRK